jgi:hypothetical protein
VIVYGRPSGYDNYGGGYLTTYYACLRPNGKPVAVGQSSTAGEYPGNYAMYELRVSGRFVADLSGSGFAVAAACGKYAGTNCEQSVSWWLEAVDTKSRRSLHLSLSNGFRGLAVSSAGAAAWIAIGGTSTETLQAIVLHPAGRRQLRGTVETLDTGATGTLRSLRFTGLTLQWNSAGQAKRQVLH